MFDDDDDHFYLTDASEDVYDEDVQGDDYYDDCALIEDFVSELESLRDKVNWDITAERRKFLRKFYNLIVHWKGQLPDLRGIFSREQMDHLLTESVKFHNLVKLFETNPFITIVMMTGYRDEPELDDGEPRLRRTTPVHWAARYMDLGNDDLFQIYDKFQANYQDEFGYTHFHAACQSGQTYVVEKFLELGQDPNCPCEKMFPYSPLVLALRSGYRNIVELLLRRGADPNLANAKGLTPLHVLCMTESRHTLTRLFFDVNDELSQRVQLDVRDDKSGRTPLETAVANLLPFTMEILLDRGADLASFVFPTELDCKTRFFCNPINPCEVKLTLASRVLDVVERLKKRGYQLQRDDALVAMRFFAKHQLHDKPDNVGFWRSDHEFDKKAHELWVNPRFSLHSLVRLPANVAEKLVTLNQFEFAGRYMAYVWRNSPFPSDACAMHLCEMMSRGFFRRWALEPLLELTRYRLPILCCDMIIDGLMNEDLGRVCLAAAGQD